MRASKSIVTSVAATGLTAATLAVAAVAALTGACSIPDKDYQASIDATSGGPGFVVENFPGTVDELGTKTFTVKLDRAPGTTVQVTLASTGPISVSPDVFDLSDSSWDTGQQVTLTGLDDINAVDDDGAVDVMAQGFETRHLVTRVTDTDVFEIVVSATGIVSVDEAMGPVQFTAQLSAQPEGDTTVMVQSSIPAALMAGPDLTFTSQDWNQPHTVTLTAPDDVNTISEMATVTLDDGAGPLPAKVVNVQVIDDDTLSITATPSPNPLNLVEEGAPGTVAVSLSQQPPNAVTVTVTHTAGISVDQPQLSFSTSNWNMSQNLVVSVPPDDDTASGSATITLATTSVPNVPNRTVTVNFTDNDTQVIQENAPPTIMVTEGQSPQKFQVSLAFQPAGTVQVDVTSLDSLVATASPSTLFFTSSNYSEGQDVSVAGTQDNNLAPGSTTVRLSGGGAPAMVDIPVSVTDDDQQVIVVSPTTLNIDEGASGTVNVRLMYQPAGTVTVMGASNNGEVTLTGPPLSFTPSTYMTNQPVTVTAATDPDNVPDTATLSFTGAGAPSPATVTVGVNDTTVIETWGWPSPTFGNSAPIANPSIIAYQIPGMVTNGTLDKYGLIPAVGSGDFKLAIYTNDGNKPDMRVHSIETRSTITSTAPMVIDVADVPIDGGSYWIAIRATSISLATAGAGPPTTLRCSAVVTPTTLDDAWPDSFGNSNCTIQGAPNLYFVTYR